MTTGRYRDWESIDYSPAVPAHYPDAILAELPAGANVLEIGCHHGTVSLYLAAKRADLRVRGIDINASSIAAARRRAAELKLPNATFDVADATTDGDSIARCDGVVAIRVLTCFADVAEWRALVDASLRFVRPHGCWYAVDYLFDEANPAYAARYQEGLRAGWRRGNFRVDAADGAPLFIAHHHTEEELACLTSKLYDVRLRRFESLSMHGNRAAMFELIGRRPEAVP